MSPIALVGPLIAAAVTAEWQYLPAGLLVGAGGLLAGTGGAIVQSTIVPVAIPESENPFAAGESGRGIMAALLLGGVLIGLALVTLPVALALLWANSRSSVPLVTLQIADAISGNVLVGQENVALALSLDMVLVAGLVMAVYLPLQRRSARWLA